MPNLRFRKLREGVAEKLHSKQQELRKKSGLPHPDYYKELGKSYDIKDDSERMAHQSSLKKKYSVKEEVEHLEEKNVPTSPEKWAQAKAQAKSKFDVYPSAYANGWAAKKYKEMGGGWKSVNENTDDPSAAARTLSRKAQIVRDAAKGRKQDQEQASDKFQKDPELSSDIQKT